MERRTTIVAQQRKTPQVFTLRISQSLDCLFFMSHLIFQVKEDTCYVSSDFNRDMNIARYILSYYKYISLKPKSYISLTSKVLL